MGRMRVSALVAMVGVVGLVLGGEPMPGEVGAHGHSFEVLPVTTTVEVPSTSTSWRGKSTYLPFTDPAGAVLARLNITSDLVVDLLTTKCQGTMVGDFCCDSKSDEGKCSGDKRWEKAGMVVADKRLISFGLSGTIESKGTNTITSNSSLLTLTVNYTAPKSSEANVTVTAASLVITVTPEGEVRGDYWNLTSATLHLTGTFTDAAKKTTTLPKTTDVTPVVGYSRSQPACTAPYAPCAPRALAWSCDDQVLYPTPTSVNASHFSSIGALTVRTHLRGMLLRLGGNSSWENDSPLYLGYSWDCDPLIPISVWVSVLITLFLASILLWGLCMLATVNGPTKFDDPKGPSLYVPSTE